MAEMSVNLSCPSCGGALSIDEGAKLVNCKYCDALLAVEGEGGVFKTTFKNNLAEPQASGVLKNWFTHGLKARDLPAKATITELYPIYLPFWRYNARAAGWVCGYEERRRTDSQGHVTTERIDMERMVFRDFDWSRIACDAGDLGIRTMKNLRGEAMLHEEGSIPTFEATTSAADARQQGEDSVRAMARSSAGVPHITFEKIHVIPHFLNLIFYPVWIGRYEYSGRSYFATVDGVTGQTLSGRAPGDPLYRAGIMTAGSAAGGILGGLGLSPILGDTSGELRIGLLIAGIVIFGLTWYFFRHGSEVEEGDIAKDYLGGNLANIGQQIQGMMR